MRNFTFKTAIFTLIAIFSVISGCKKTEAVDTTVSYLRVVNGAPTLATYNVYLSGNILNASALPYAGSTAYTARNAGAYNLKFTNASSTESLFSKDITLNTSTNYSYYLVNKPGQLDGFIVVDDFNTNVTDKAFIRFVNLAPDAPALDLVKTGAAKSLVSNKAYKTASAFTAIDAGTISLEVKDNVSGLIKTTKADVTFAAGYRYDIICGGFTNPANDTERSLDIQVLTIK